MHDCYEQPWLDEPEWTKKEQYKAADEFRELDDATLAEYRAEIISRMSDIELELFKIDRTIESRS